MKKFIYAKEARCPLCNKKMSEDEDETVWRCRNKKCPVNWVQIADKHGNPITQPDTAG